MTSPNETLYAGKAPQYFGGARTEIEPLLPEHARRVLEIGCGAGANIAWLRSIRNVQYAAGVELVPDAARRAAAVLDAIVVGNVESLELPFQLHSFDLILALYVLEHLVDPWTVVRRLHQLLRPGGAIIASIPNVGHYSIAIPLALRGRWDYAYEGILDRTHLRFFVERTAVELMRSSGLVVDKIDRSRLLPQGANGWPTAYGGARVRWYLSKALKRLLPSHLIDYQFLIRARSPEERTTTSLVPLKFTSILN